MARRSSSKGLGAVIGLRLPADLESRLQADADRLLIPVSTHIRGLLQSQQGGSLRGLGAGTGYESGFQRGFEEGLRRGLSQVKSAITKAIAGLWPK